MGFKITKRRDTPSFPIEITYIEDFPGGGTLSLTGLTRGEVIQKGTLVSFDEGTRLATVFKTAVLAEAAAEDSTTYKIAKTYNGQPHGFADGDVVTAEVEGAAYEGTIDTSDPDFDVITVPTTLGVELPAGTVLFQSPSAGADTGAFTVTPNGWLREDVDVDENAFVSIGRMGTLYERRLPYAVPQAVKDELKGIIKFSQQR